MKKSLILKKENKVLIVGGNGLFSFNFLYLLKDKLEIHCFSRDKEGAFDGVYYHLVDSYNCVESVQELIAEIDPLFVINAAGLTSVERCEDEPDLAFYANVSIPETLSIITKSLGKKIVHISTDHFCSSTIFEANEQQIELPKNYYASTKLEADRRVIKENPDHLIVRTNFFGWGHSKRKSFSDFILEGGEKQAKLKLFYDVLFSPILVDDLIDDIIELVERDLSGVFNIIGNQSVTKYSFGKNLLKSFGFSNNEVEKDYLVQRSGLVPRPLDMSLSRQKLNEALGFKENRNLERMIDKLRITRERREFFLSLT